MASKDLLRRVLVLKPPRTDECDTASFERTSNGNVPSVGAGEGPREDLKLPLCNYAPGA